MEAIKAWLDIQVESMMPQSALSQTVRCMIEQWPGLKNYPFDDTIRENALHYRERHGGWAQRTSFWPKPRMNGRISTV
jgi:hypothetical protein